MWQPCLPPRAGRLHLQRPRTKTLTSQKTLVEKTANKEPEQWLETHGASTEVTGNALK